MIINRVALRLILFVLSDGHLVEGPAQYPIYIGITSQNVINRGYAALYHISVVSRPTLDWGTLVQVKSLSNDINSKQLHDPHREPRKEA